MLSHSTGWQGVKFNEKAEAIIRFCMHIHLTTYMKAHSIMHYVRSKVSFIIITCPNIKIVFAI
jgi:hypothetical protein